MTYDKLLAAIHDRIAMAAGIKRSRVKCSECGREQEVDGGKCLAHGWPTCCGYTMVLQLARKP